MTIWKYKRQTCLDSRSVWAGHIKESEWFLHQPLWCYMLSLKLTFVPEWLSFPQTAVNHRKVSVLSDRHCGKAEGNCELIAISFVPLCICQCRREANWTDGDVILLLFMLRFHMVSIPVDMAELCMPDMSTGNVKWGLQQNSEQASSTPLLVSLLLYCWHENVRLVA